jgi:hypothetical protein
LSRFPGVRDPPDTTSLRFISSPSWQMAYNLITANWNLKSAHGTISFQYSTFSMNFFACDHFPISRCNKNVAFFVAEIYLWHIAGDNSNVFFHLDPLSAINICYNILLLCVQQYSFLLRLPYYCIYRSDKITPATRISLGNIIQF